MDWTVIKGSREAALDGIDITFEREGGTIQSVVFSNAKGQKVRVGVKYSDLSVSVPAKPATVEKFKVTATVADVPVERVLDDEYAATVLKRELEYKGADNPTVERVEEEVCF